MPRIRSLKPEIATDAKLSRVSRDARLTFVLMITQADDAGLLPGAHRQVLGLLYPLDDSVTIALLLGWIEELVGIGVVRWRSTRDGVPVLELTNWGRHQRIDNAGRSQLAPLLADDRENSPRSAATEHTAKTPEPTLAELRGESRRVAEVRRLDLGPRSKDLGEGEGERTEDRRPLSIVPRSAVDDLLAEYDFGIYAPQVAAVCHLSRMPESAVAILRLHLTAEAGYEPATPQQIGSACVAFAANGEGFGQAHFAGYLRRAKRQFERYANRQRNVAEASAIATERAVVDTFAKEQADSDALIARHASEYPDAHAEFQRSAEREVPATITLGREIMVRAHLLRLIRGRAA